jgi:uncharacterized membrane protein
VKSWTLIVWGLYLASFFSLATTQIIGLIIAYVKRRDAAGTPFESHMIYAIRTFLIGLGVELIGLILSVVGIGVGVLGSSFGSFTASSAVSFGPSTASRSKTL